MVEFVKRNRRLLEIYSTVLRVFGWILLCMGGVGLALLTLEGFKTGGPVSFEGALGTFKRSYHYFVKIGLLSLGFGQLVRYLIGKDIKMGPLLRYGEKLFYLYAGIVIWQAVLWFWIVATGRTGGTSPLLHRLISLLPTLIYEIAKVLLLVGAGQFLRHFIAATGKEKE
jgi:hypothetical protein